MANSAAGVPQASGRQGRRKGPIVLIVALALLASTVVVGTVSRMLTASAVPPINLLGPSGSATVAWGEPYVGADPAPAGYVYPEEIYNYGDWDTGGVYPADGTTYSAATINGNTSSSSPISCDESWQWVQILCDPQAPGGATLGSTNSADYVYKMDTDAGYTIDTDDDPLVQAYVVVDLGSSQSFNTLRIFQMFSDGKVTRAALYTHPSTGTTRPAYNDAGWSLAKESPIGTGKEFADGIYDFVGCPTVMSLGARTSRYIKLVFMNSGEFDDPSWVEVGAAKLFNETAPYVPDPQCPPEPPVSPVATAGDTQATLTWTPGSGTATGWTIEQSIDNGVTWTVSTTSPSTLPASPASATITGLTNGTQYVFRVRALNATNGDSPFTPKSNAVTPNVPPPTPPAPPAPSGGGGAPAPAPTPTPTPTPTSTPTIPPLIPVLNQENGNVPASGIPLGASLLLVNGVPTGVVVAPNAPANATGLVVAGDGFTMRLAGLNAQGQPMGLSSDGGALVLEQDRTAQVEGTGFLPNSEVRLFVFSTPRYIGSVSTDASGNFNGRVPIPMDLSAGRHTLQANGYSPSQQVRSLSLGVEVRPDRAPKVRVARTTVTFAPLSSELSVVAKAQLRALAKGRSTSATRTLVVGYVQPTSTSTNDRALSNARAAAVKAFLRSLGLKGAVDARGSGKATETGAAGRKVVVAIRYTK